MRAHVHLPTLSPLTRRQKRRLVVWPGTMSVNVARSVWPSRPLGLVRFRRSRASQNAERGSKSRGVLVLWGGMHECSSPGPAPRAGRVHPGRRRGAHVVPALHRNYRRPNANPRSWPTAKLAAPRSRNSVGADQFRRVVWRPARGHGVPSLETQIAVRSGPRHWEFDGRRPPWGVVRTRLGSLPSRAARPFLRGPSVAMRPHGKVLAAPAAAHGI